MLNLARSAAPIYLAVVATTIGATVDAAVLGHYDTTALARFTAVMAVFIPAVTVVTGAQRGVVPSLAQAVDDPQRLRANLRASMWLALAVGALGAAAVLGTRGVGRLVGAAEEVAQVPVTLLVLLAASVVLTAVQATGSAVAIALDRAGLVFRAGVTATAVGVAGTLLLVPALGLVGTGWAMLASTATYAVLVHATVARSAGLGAAAVRIGRPPVAAIVALARVGIPLAATVLVKFAVLGVVALAVTRQGVDAAAAHTVALSLANLAFAAAVAIGQAVIPRVARAEDRAGRRAPVVDGVKLALVTLVVVGALVAVLHAPIVGVFTSDPAVARAVTNLLPIVAVVVLADAVQAVVGFGLVGLRRASASLLGFAACYGVLAVLAVPVADAGGLEALWIALAVANGLLVVIQSTFFTRLSSNAPPRIIL
ncbi:MATE family efflux transporter [Solirubrobacter phytolaccae]|uniref:MATE family efflux transporter n=1 Tax=Solirubrobacter phytolaccae TaxID=1404360 RepID=A0A9X3S891_9ACTN|nr:MATE family efflux transporter [Solirubrobacter phytolaccae]MDA0180036.1 MATE family efflux transporter [Solirubrobacter phytolaccae]